MGRATVGMDFRKKNVEIDGYRYGLTLWDTAGQEKYQAIGRGYFRGSQGLLLLYDVCEADSFAHVSKWVNDIHTCTHGEAPKTYLIANKIDREGYRVVSTEQ